MANSGRGRGVARYTVCYVRVPSRSLRLVVDCRRECADESEREACQNLFFFLNENLTHRPARLAGSPGAPPGKVVGNPISPMVIDSPGRAKPSQTLPAGRARDTVGRGVGKHGFPICSPQARFTSGRLNVTVSLHISTALHPRTTGLERCRGVEMKAGWSSGSEPRLSCIVWCAGCVTNQAYWHTNCGSALRTQPGGARCCRRQAPGER